MKKFLLSLVALMTAMSSFAALKTAVFDMSNPASMGFTASGANAPIGTGSLVVGDITITVAADASSALQKVRFNTAAGVTTLKYGKTCALKIATSLGNIRSIKYTGDKCGAEDVTVDCGTWTANTWSGEATAVVLTQAGDAATVSKIEVVYQVPNEVDPRPLGEVEVYEAVGAVKGDAQLNEDGTPKVDAYGEPMYSYTYEFSPEFAAPVQTDGALTVNYGTTHVKAVSVAGADADQVDATGVLTWKEMKFELKNNLNDGTSNLHQGIALGTGNPVFGYEIEPVWTEGSISGYRQCFNKQNPDYDGAAEYAAKQAGETYSIPHYLEDKFYYWKPGCGKLPGQGLYHQFTADCDGQLKIFVWVNKGNRNTYLIDATTIEPVEFQCEGYMNNQNVNVVDPTDPEKTVSVKKLLSPLDVEVLNDPAKPYVICGTQAGGQVFWGNIIYDIKAGQTVMLFQESSQIGIGGFTFAPYVTDGIENVAVAPAAKITKTVENGQVVIKNGAKTFNVAGQLVK